MPRRRPRVPPRPARWPDEEGAGVEDRTVAERRGEAVRPLAGRRPPPPGWPLEALVFPLRGPGPATAGACAVLWTLLDLATAANLFLGFLLKVTFLPFFLRWHFHVAGTSAAGQDRPPPWARAMDIGRETLGALARFLLAALALLLPGGLALALGHQGVGFTLLAGASLLLAAGALGEAVGDPGLLRPWRAAAWLGRRPLALAVGALGGWALGGAEWLGSLLGTLPLVWRALLLLGIRLVALHLWLISARALGVAGRAWTPWDPDGTGADDGRPG